MASVGHGHGGAGGFCHRPAAAIARPCPALHDTLHPCDLVPCVHGDPGGPPYRDGHPGLCYSPDDPDTPYAGDHLYPRFLAFPYFVLLDCVVVGSAPGHGLADDLVYADVVAW